MGMSVTKAIKKLRREAAEIRQAAYDKLTLEEKLAKLPPEPRAARQRARLLKLLTPETKVEQTTETTEKKKAYQKKSKS